LIPCIKKSLDHGLRIAAVKGVREKGVCVGDIGVAARAICVSREIVVVGAAVSVATISVLTKDIDVSMTSVGFGEGGDTRLLQEVNTVVKRNNEMTASLRIFICFLPFIIREAGYLVGLPTKSLLSS
jgi:hypothetical protein